jgi:TRAP-type C4-dicarboxylate transport system permease small subunit
MDAASPARNVPQPPALLLRAGRAFGAVAALALVGMVLLTCIDVIGRYVLNRPLTGAFELSEMAMGALVFASLPLVTLRRQQVTVDLFDRILPAAWRPAQDAVANIVAALCVGVIAWRLWIKASDMMRTGETTATLRIPVYPLVYYMALLSFLTALVIVVMAWLDATHRSGKP